MAKCSCPPRASAHAFLLRPTARGRFTNSIQDRREESLAEWGKQERFEERRLLAREALQSHMSAREHARASTWTPGMDLRAALAQSMKDIEEAPAGKGELLVSPMQRDLDRLGVWSTTRR